MNESVVKKIARRAPPHPFEDYAHVISPLAEDEGGGYLITFPDLPGCMSDGATEDEAVAQGREAFEAWISARLDAGKPVPEPAYRPERTPPASGRFVTRLPKSVHAQLAERAKAEGVSLNTLVITFIAEGLGRRDAGAGP
ncbi:MAG TPA: type II toxin-antitoxin system HicB family antitoxin [Rhodocyclaceae bacterium]|nr:type II toxin-antitoxin system HicB family antitoxin [Rhodocyclaceae bacterium]